MMKMNRIPYPHFIMMLLMLSGSLAMAQEAVQEAPKVEKVELETAKTKPSQPKRYTKKSSEFRVSRHTFDRSEKEADQVNVWLGMGLDRIFDVDPAIKLGDRQGSILESNTNVVKLSVFTIGEKKQFVLRGIAEGNSNIVIRDVTGEVKIIYNVVVAKQDLIRMMDDLKRNLQEIEGIDFKIEGQKVVIDGEVLTPNDYGALVNVITDKIYSDSVSNRVTMSPVTLNALSKKIESDVQSFAPTVTTSVINGKIILEGTVDSDGVKQRVLRRAEWYLPTTKVSEPINKDANNVEKKEKPLEIIQSDLQVAAPQPKRESKLLRISVYFVELSKDFLKAFGFKWQPGFSADPSISIGSSSTGSVGTSNSAGFTFAGTLSALIPSIGSTPASSAYGRILKSATLIVKSGERSKLKDISQFPTQQLGQGGAVTNGQPVQVGLDIEVTPTILQGQDVDLSIALDQSNVVGTGVGGTPITASHHAETRLYLKSGEVGAVVDLSKSSLSTTFNRDDPEVGTFSGSARPLFTLQRSKSMSKKRGQFVVFISPQIIDSASEGTEDLKKNFRMKSN